MKAAGGSEAGYGDMSDCPDGVNRGQTFVSPDSAVLCLSESSRCLPLLLLTSLSLTLCTQSKWSTEGSLNPDKCYKSPPAAALLHRPANRARSSPALAT